MHPLHKFRFCPVCGSNHFEVNDEKSRRCQDCGFVYYLNPSAATVAIIVNERGELLVAVRDREPAKGTLDLPGGFTDMGETVEEGVAREVTEETGLQVLSTQYLFSRPNRYEFSQFVIPTLDFFFRCDVADADSATAHDDAAELLWIPLPDVRPEKFGLTSIRQGVELFLRMQGIDQTSQKSDSL